MRTPNATRDLRLIQDTVANLAHFKGLARDRLTQVVRLARLERMGRGSWVARRGEQLQGVVAIAKGMVKLAMRGAGDAERVLRFVGPGETFGEASVLLGRPSAVDALTLADTVLAVIASASIRSLMASDARFARRMAKLLAERMLVLLAEIEASELRPAGERLASYLLTLAQPTAEAGRWTAHLPATKTLVAARLGMKKETLSRLLHDLASRRLIEVSRRDIAILEPQRLQELAHSGLP